MRVSRLSLDAAELVAISKSSVGPVVKVIGGIGVIKLFIMVGCGRAPPAGKPKYKHRWNR